MKKYFYNHIDETLVIVDTVNGSIAIAHPLGETPKPSNFAQKIKERSQTLAIAAPAPTERKSGRKATTCKKCGGQGHNSRSCSEDSESEDDEEETETDSEFEVTDDIRDEINELLLDGMSSIAIANHFNIGLKDANKAIAIAKGISLPK